MRPRSNHPMLAGCRLLWLPLGRAKNRNFGRGGGGGATSLTVTGSNHRSRVPRLVFTSGGSDGVNLPTPNALGMSGTRMTAIVRFRMADAAAGSVYDLFKSNTGLGNTGFALFMVRGGFTNIGVNLAVFDGGGNAWVRYASGVNTNGRDMVIAGVFDNTTASGSRYLKVYIDGRRADDSDSGSPGTGSSAWSCAGADPVSLGHTSSGGDELDGEIGFAALFDRVLSDAEILRWSQESLYDWLGEEDQVVTDGANSFSTPAGVRSVLAASVGGAARFASPLEASFSVGGDFSVEPTLPAEFATAVGVKSIGKLGIPLLAQYKTQVTVGSVLTSTAPHSYSTAVGVRQSARAYPDGRVELLGGSRYRR